VQSRVQSLPLPLWVFYLELDQPKLLYKTHKNQLLLMGKLVLGIDLELLDQPLLVDQ